MKGIKLFESYKLFGLDAISFWFRWSFIYPLQDWYRLNTIRLTKKYYCLNCGWHCKEGCEEEKLKTKQEVLNHWEKFRKELDHIEIGNDGKCVYCGDEEGTEIIPNPNMDKNDKWLVCKYCKEVIKLQQVFSMAELINNVKMMEEAQERMIEIAKITGKPIFMTYICKGSDGKYKSSSVEFNGKR